MTEMSREVWRSRAAAMAGKNGMEKLELYESATDEEIAEMIRRDPEIHAMWRLKFPGVYPE